MKAISMRCTQEQFDRIKQKLVKAGLRNSVDESFTAYPYLTSPLKGKDNFNNHNKLTMDMNREIHETWNERIFLEACGIEVDEKFEISKEQIKILRESSSLYNANRNLEYWFPQAFEKEKKEVELTVGKWYKNENHLIYYKGNERCCGFVILNGAWIEDCGHNLRTHKECDYTEATQEEVKEALIVEAKKRGFKEWVYFIPTNNESDDPIRKSYSEVTYGYCEEENKLTFCNRSVFHNGIWASIVPVITKAEAEKLLNKKII